MRLVKNNIPYSLPSLSSVDKNEFTTRGKSESKSMQHGGILAGDGKVEARNISVEVIIDGKTKDDYRQQVDELKRYAYRTNQKLFITDTQYINAACLSKFTEKFYPGFYMVKGVIDLTFLCLDPFFYDDYTLTTNKTITESPTEFTVFNPGNAECNPVIKITAVDICSAITLKNITDNGRRLDYNDVQMIAGQELTIDSTAGTIKRGTTNTINNLLGTFLNLLPGENVIEYTGGDCTIQIIHPVRWL